MIANCFSARSSSFLSIRFRQSFAAALTVIFFTAIAGCGNSPSPTPVQITPVSPVASLSATSYTFGVENVGTASAPQAFTLTNTGTGALTISGFVIGGTNATSFSLFNGTNACGDTLAAGASCSVSAYFNPQVPGNLAGTLTISDNSATTTQTIALSGPATIGPSKGTPESRSTAMLSLMTQAEKLQMVQGGVTTDLTYGYTVPLGAAGFVAAIPRLGIPALYLADGSVGAGNGLGAATALPSSLANAASWDLVEAQKYGTVIGTELADLGANVNLGGNVNLIGREPRDGRSFETKGEDPMLAGKITAAHISAIQAQHIIGGIKHFSFNDQESGRTTANAIIDERSGRESDLLAFEIGIKDSNVQSVMCSYNLTNGQYDCENSYLLNQVLKGYWGFQGFVMSDWWGTHSTAAAAINGLDQEQPNQQYFSTLGTAITNGQVPQSRLDDMVQRILRAMYTVGIFDNPQNIQPIPAGADAAVAEEIEETGAVLLKISAAQLPLNGSALKSIAVIGSHADTSVLSGGGSAQVQPVGGASLTGGQPCPPCWAQVVWDPSSPLAAIKAKAPGATVQYVDGSSTGAATSLAASSQVAIVFVNQWASEGMDETSLALNDLVDSTPIDQDALVAAVAAANPHTIVVVESGSAILMPWLGQVNAVLETWYPGQSGGPAIADLLFGTANPSGKLPITFPASDSQLPRPVIPQPPDGVTPFNVNYTEGYNVGYKWFDVNQMTPLFPFGYGLSYTTFTMTDAALTNNLNSAPTPNFQVTLTLTNTGSVAGAEVSQVYLGLPASLNEPPKRLVGWQKVTLQPGASQQVTIEVDQNDSSQPMSYWNTTTESWTIAPGTYTVYLGNSSVTANLTTVGTITVN